MAAGLAIVDGGSTNRTITAFLVIDGGSVDRTITEGRIIDGNGNDRVFYDPSGAHSFTASPSQEETSGFGIGTAITDAITVTPSGGTAPYSYAWTRTSSTHPTTDPTATAPTAAATTFEQTSMAAGSIYSSEWRCTVTDSSAPALTATADITAHFADTSTV